MRAAPTYLPTCEMMDARMAMAMVIVTHHVLKMPSIKKVLYVDGHTWMMLQWHLFIVQWNHSMLVTDIIHSDCTSLYLLPSFPPFFRPSLLVSPFGYLCDE
jgi:hypothetical protein